MARFIERDWHDYLRTIGMVVALVVGTLFALLVLRPHSGTAVTVIFFIALFWTLTSFFSRAYGYRCAACKRVFRVPTAVNFFTPSGVARNPDGTYYAWKSLTCPRCGERTRARVLKKADMSGTGMMLKDSAARRKE